MAFLAEGAKIILVKKVTTHPDRDYVVYVKFILPETFPADAATIIVSSKDIFSHKSPGVVAVEF
ncbi:MAG: hypothetical protein ACLFP2_02310 [Candidatus Woesearchaeota archaeon]